MRSRLFAYDVRRRAIGQLVALVLTAGLLLAMLFWLVPPGERFTPLVIWTVVFGTILTLLVASARVGGRVELTIDDDQQMVSYRGPSKTLFGQPFELKFNEISAITLVSHRQAESTSVEVRACDHTFQLDFSREENEDIALALSSGIGKPLMKEERV